MLILNLQNDQCDFLFRAHVVKDRKKTKKRTAQDVNKNTIVEANSSSYSRNRAHVFAKVVMGGQPASACACSRPRQALGSPFVAMSGDVTTLGLLPAARSACRRLLQKFEREENLEFAV